MNWEPPRVSPLLQVIRGMCTDERPYPEIDQALARAVDAAQTVEDSGGGWHDAGASAWYAWQRLSEATTPIQHAHAMVDLCSAIADLGTWLPGWDVETGTIVEGESCPSD